MQTMLMELGGGTLNIIKQQARWNRHKNLLFIKSQTPRSPVLNQIRRQFASSDLGSAQQSL